MTGIFWGASGFTGNMAMLCLLGYGTFSNLNCTEPADGVQVDILSLVVRSLLVILRVCYCTAGAYLAVLTCRPALTVQICRRISLRPDWILHRSNER